MSVAERRLAEQVLDLATSTTVPGLDRGDLDVEVAVDHDTLGLTRFANSIIHQHVTEDATAVRVRVHATGRTVTASTTRSDDQALAAFVTRTLESLQAAPLDPGWPGLTQPLDVPRSSEFDDAAAAAAPDDRARVVRAFVDGAGGLTTAGFCRTTVWHGAFVNSAGHVAEGATTEAALDGVAKLDERPTPHGEAADRSPSDAAAPTGAIDGVMRLASNRLTDLDGARCGARAAAKVRAGAEPIELAPGRYQVVLEPMAVSDILQALGTVALTGKAIADGRSFVEVGTSQFDPSVTLVDDPLASGLTYDLDGTPRRRTTLVDAGTTTAIVHDRRSAAEAGTTSTGNAAQPSTLSSPGPFAINLALRPGSAPATSGRGAPEPVDLDGPMCDGSVARLVAGVERGLLVTDFWYTRVLDPKTLSITGLTRNGVWLIERGEVTRPLRNLRFTQSYAEALAPGNVLGIGDTVTPQPDRWGPTRWHAPAVHLASWNFTGGASG